MIVEQNPRQKQLLIIKEIWLDNNEGDHNIHKTFLGRLETEVLNPV